MEATLDRWTTQYTDLAIGRTASKTPRSSLKPQAGHCSGIDGIGGRVDLAGHFQSAFGEFVDGTHGFHNHPLGVFPDVLNLHAGAWRSHQCHS